MFSMFSMFTDVYCLVSFFHVTVLSTCFKVSKGVGSLHETLSVDWSVDIMHWLVEAMSS